MVYPALLTLICTPRLSVVDWTDAPRRFKWNRPFRAKDEIWFLRLCHHISTGLYKCNIHSRSPKPSLPWESNKYYIFWVYVCSPGYTSCKVHAPYYMVICSPSGSTMFHSHYLVKSKISGKDLLNIKCVLQLMSETFLIIIIIIISNLSNDRSKASSKTIPPHSAI